MLRYSPTTDEFRQLAAVAAAQDIPLINGGYVYDAEHHRAAAAWTTIGHVERLDPSDLATRFDSLDPDIELSLRPFLAVAQRAMDPLGCEVVLRAFEPAGTARAVPARPGRRRSAARSATPGRRPTRCGPMCCRAGGDRPRRASATGAQLPQPVGTPDHRAGRPGLVGLAVEALYGQALLLGLPPGPAGRRRPAQPTPSSACSSRRRPWESIMTHNEDELWDLLDQASPDALRPGPDRCWSSR